MDSGIYNLNTGFDTSLGPGFDSSFNAPYYAANAPVASTTVSTPDLGTPEVTGSNPTTFRVFKIIVIVILVILIIVAIVLAVIFRNNALNAESVENPSCPTLNCPVGNPTYPLVVSDPKCGSSSFRFEGTNKICNSDRYAKS